MKRRNFLFAAGGAVLLPVLLPRLDAATNAVDASDGLPETETLQTDWNDYLPADFPLPVDLTPLDIDKDEWKRRLSSSAYRVLFKEGTEPAGSSPLDHETREGAFLCGACDLPLFTSAMKFDSGTGWPSFYTVIPGHIDTSRDFKLILPRTEYHCIRCGGHQGHRFDDGPAPTGERWCNNGVALRFVAKDGSTEAQG